MNKIMEMCMCIHTCDPEFNKFKGKTEKETQLHQGCGVRGEEKGEKKRGRERKQKENERERREKCPKGSSACMI